MKEVFYNCNLLSDVVLNSSLATECNMSTLDSIPGSNFLGIVAAKLYPELKPEETYDIFHSGNVSFGDATISQDNAISYPIPFSLFMDKLNKEMGKDQVYLHHCIDMENPPQVEGRKLQLKQERAGYVFSNGNIIKSLEKNFALKSAQDRKTRTSADSKMFGFESLEKGQNFIFSVLYKDEQNISKIDAALLGTKRLGKSKTAEYGQVEISKINDKLNAISSFQPNDYVLVYAQSNLCFTNEFGQATFQPTIEQLGLSAGTIDWSKSQIRTFAYSPWNFKRNTSNSQRDCIAKGSVFYVTDGKVDNTSNQIGLHTAEGLGRVIYNPKFLEESNELPKAKLQFKNSENKKYNKADKKEPTTLLTKFLVNQKELKDNELLISKAIHELIYSETPEIKKLVKISSSQWGGIRAYATKTQDINKLEKQLFDKDNGYLTHGVADEKYWGKNRGVNIKNFKHIFDENSKYGTVFIAKFAAEMAKENKRQEKKLNNGK